MDFSKAANTYHKPNDGDNQGKSTDFQSMYEKEKAANTELMDEIENLGAKASALEQANRLMLEERDTTLKNREAEAVEREIIVSALQEKPNEKFALFPRITELQDRVTQLQADEDTAVRLKDEIVRLVSDKDRIEEEKDSLESMVHDLSDKILEKDERMKTLLKDLAKT